MVFIGTPEELRIFHNECGKSTCAHCALNYFCTKYKLHSKSYHKSQIDAIINDNENGFEKIDTILIT